MFVFQKVKKKNSKGLGDPARQQRYLPRFLSLFLSPDSLNCDSWMNLETNRSLHYRLTLWAIFVRRWNTLKRMRDGQLGLVRSTAMLVKGRLVGAPGVLCCFDQQSLRKPQQRRRRTGGAPPLSPSSSTPSVYLSLPQNRNGSYARLSFSRLPWLAPPSGCVVFSHPSRPVMLVFLVH